MKLAKLLSLAILISLPIAGYSQCKSFAKRKCLPTLKPFIHNGQLNSTTLMEGESAELVMTFHAGQQYRLKVCARETLGNVSFKVMDMQRDVIFDSSKEKSAPDNWDFDVNATQQMIIMVSVPKAKSSSADLPGTLVQSGCVALLVGFKVKS